MATENSSTAGGGLGFIGVLTILLIALKLLGVLTWSWLWVLSPLWIAALGLVAVLLVVGSVFLAIRVSKGRRRGQN